LVVCAQTDDPGGRRGDTVWIIARWRCPVASNVRGCTGEFWNNFFSLKLFFVSWML
jgi:hypothetical protein